MARRRKSNNTVEEAFDLFHELFLHVPAWICLPVAVVVFIGAKILISSLGSTNLLFQTLAVQYGTLFAGFLGGMVLLAGGTAALKKGQRRKLYHEQTGIDSIRNLSWSQFEVLVGEAYRHQGYEVTEIGGCGPDGGIDLRMRSNLGEIVIVQCKQWKVYKVGVRPVRELYGVMMAERVDRAIFVTSGVYTREAEKFAEGKNLQLIDGEKLTKLIASARQYSSIQESKETLRPPMLDESLACPVCHSEMVLRTAKRGANVGSQFWGCSSYPRCRGTRQA